MKTRCAIAAAALASVCVATTAAGANCVSHDDMLALRTAAIQQELMVAALTCREIGRYNRFVVSHRPELVESDDRLKDYFVRRSIWHREAKYHLYKTELANTASLRSARRAGAFCAQASAAFDLAESSGSLSRFVAVQPVAVGRRYHACGGPRLPTLAEYAPSRHRGQFR